MTRGNSDVARTARERGRADSKLADRVRTKEESRRRDHKDRVARPSHRSDRPLTQRLAAIDRIRDRALETGNVQLLDRADRLEQSARREFRENMKASIDQPLPGEMDQSRMQGHAHWKTDETRRPYGQSISALARELGGEFGRQTSEQARESGREFGKMNADKTRPDIYQPVIDLPSEPPVKEPDTEPVVEPGGTEPGIKPDTEPVIEPGIEPVKEPDTEPVVEPGGTEPVVEPATEPVKEPDTDSNSDSAG